MNIKFNTFLLIFASLFATFLRYFINNLFIISLSGSFFFGFVIAKKLNNSANRIVLSGFCSSYTTFSGLIYFLYKLINEVDFLRIFVFLNIFILLNLLIMYLGYYLSRKIT